MKLEATIRRFGEADMKCIITELDMGIPSTSEADLLEQARNYRVITDIVLNNDNCPNMVIWGIKDNDSWRSASNPLLYTAAMAKKKAWYAVRSALRHRTLSTGITAPHQLSSSGYPLGSDASSDEELSTLYTLDGRPVSTRNLRPGLYIMPQAQGHPQDQSARKILIP